MSTPSRIGILRDDGIIESIYCHWDGYPENNGKILTEHYSDRKKVEKLIKLGDISNLAPLLEPASGLIHTFDFPVKDVVVAYHRDRSEGGEPNISEDHSINDFLENNEQYLYLMVDTQWLVFDGRTLSTIQEVLAKTSA